MPRIDYQGFTGGTYIAATPIVAADRAINLYPEIVESGTGTVKLAFVGVPGTSIFCTLPDVPVRGIFVEQAEEPADDIVWAVGGNTVYQIAFNGTLTQVGTIAGDGPVTFASSKGGLAICDGANVWIWNGAGFDQAFFQVDGAPTDPVDARAIQFLGGYYIVLRPTNVKGGNQINVSDLFDPNSWDPLDFNVRAASGEPLVNIFVDHEHLWLFGTRTMEVWVQTGDAFPFQRYPEALIQQGLGSKWSVAAIDESFFWLGRDDRGGATAWRSNGYTPQRISNHSIERLLGGNVILGGSASDFRGYVYKEDGHQFYNLVSKQQGLALAYDTTTGMWHERWIGIWPNLTFRPVWCHAAAFGGHLVGDWDTGKIYQQNLTLPYWDGAEFTCMRVAPHIDDRLAMMVHRDLRLQVQPPTVGGEDRGTYILNISNDGGRSFGDDLIVTGPLTSLPQDVCEWRRLGRSINRVYRIRSAGIKLQRWNQATITVAEAQSAA